MKNVKQVKQNYRKCTICHSEIDPYNGDIQGHFGTMKVAFCVWCLASIEDMIENIKVK